MSSKVEACPECTRRCLHLHTKTRNLSSVPSFFKVMFGDSFSEVLYFPPMFVPTVSRLVNKKVVLEDFLGQQWKVTVSNCEGSLAIQEGWSAFSSEHGLEIGDFLVFNHITDLHFNVSIYTKTGCEKIEFAKESNTRKRTRSNCPVLEPPNEGLTNPQASCPSVGSRSFVSLSQDKCYMTGSRNVNVDRGKKPKYQSNGESHRPLCKTDIVDDSYRFINWNKDVGPEENRSLLFDLFSMEMQIVNSCIDINTTNKVAVDELNPIPNYSSTSLNAAIDVCPLNNAQVDIRRDIEPLNISADEIIDKNQCFEEAEIKKSVSDDDHCLDKTIEIPFITSATSSDKNTKHFCDTPLKTVKDCQNVPAICNTPSTITKQDQESSKKRTFPTDRCHSVKLECTPNSLEVKSCLLHDVTKMIKKEPVEIKTETGSYEDYVKKLMVPNAIKEEFLEKSNQSGGDDNVATDNNNADSIGTPAHISCIVPEDTQSFLELPTSLHLSCSRGRRNPEKKKVVFLRDVEKRLWPALYHEMPNVYVLTSGWEAFCSANKIQSGDECLFHVEDEIERIYEVLIRRCKN